jgi:Arc/MetJ-type ribon-helix-helix transcriptional regulator
MAKTGPAPKYGKAMDRRSVRLPEDLDRWVRDRAAGDGRRPSDVVREAVERAADQDRGRRASR